MLEQNIKRLEEILAKLEQNTTLNESLTLFEEASKLAMVCLEELKHAKGKIEIIKKEFDKKEDNNG